MDEKPKQSDFQEFIESTTLHGVKYVFLSHCSVSRNIIWAGVMLLASGFLVYDIYNAISKYYKYDVYMSTRITGEDYMEMPSVVFCDFNHVRNSSFEKWRFSNDITIEAGEQIGKLIYGEIYEMDQKYVHMFENISYAEFWNSTVDRNVDDVFKFCLFGLVQFNCSDYIEPLNILGYSCYTFNSPTVSQQEKVLKVHRDGKPYGLLVFVDMNTTDYSLCNYFGKGFDIHVIEPGQVPSMFQGIAVGPGQEVFISMEKVQVSTLGKPYSNECIKTNEKTGQNDSIYSREKCLLNCFYDYLYNCDGNGNYCNALSIGSDACGIIDSHECIRKRYPDYFDGKLKCECPPTCTVTKYETSVSYAALPNKVTVKSFNLSQEYIKENVAAIWVYYSAIQTIEVSENPAMDLTQLLSYFGGLAGLYVGSSIMTIVEFLDFLVRFVIIKVNKRKIIEVKMKDIQG